MKIIYGYSNCSDSEYAKLLKDSPIPVLQPDQKYHGLLIKGIAKNTDKVLCLSGLPINRKAYKKILINEKSEKEGNICYHYYKTLNLPLFRQLMIFFGGLFNCLFTKKEKDTYAICDCLNIANAYGILIGCHLRKIPVYLIVTDLPDMMSDSKIIKKINNHLFKRVDGFIALTGQMNERINKKNKPLIVMEGHVDSEMVDRQQVARYEETSGKKVVLYAGSLLKLYGVQNLVEGFIKANLENSELHIYGDGDYHDELVEICKENKNVIYYGTKPNKDIVEDEIRTSLLVNPRPSSPEYTKYSFPSKNMEYMVSGTPVLTTKLPGMPKEYYPYVKLIQDESANGIAQELKDFFNIPLEERLVLGRNAKKFVLHNKSNVEQGRKIVKWLQQLD